MDEDFDAIGAGIETALNDALNADDGGPELSDADREAGWSIKRKDAEPVAESVEATLAAVVDKAEAGADDAKAAAAWEREWRREADRALQRAGIDPAARAEHKISRRDTVRRLFGAEEMLRSDPAQGLAFVARSYAPADPAARAAIAQRVLGELGFQSPAGIAEQERAELQHHRQQAASYHAASQAAMQRLMPQVEAFRRERPDFDSLLPAMRAVVDAGEAKSVGEAYEAARRLRGMPPEGEAAAKAADEARRSKLASAKAAGTPRTAGTPLRELPPDHSNKSTVDLLNEAYDAMAR